MSGPFPPQGPQGPFQPPQTGGNPQQQYPGFPAPQFPAPQFPGQQFPGQPQASPFPGQQYPNAPQPGQGQVTQPPGGLTPQGPPTGGPPTPAQSGVSQQVFARATHATSFLTLVRVELRKLTGTRSDRILLIVGPIALIAFNLMMYLPTETFASAKDQISPMMFGVRFAAIVIHAALIKLIAGEWQHRSAQPTLLVQPSRVRYFLAQTAVVLILWLFCAALQIVMTLSLSPTAAAHSGASYLLSYRIGWVIGAGLLGSLLTIMVALTVAMLLPNAAGSLAVYFIAVPAMLILGGIAGKVFIWIDPSAAAQSLATVAPVAGPAPAIVSLIIWLGLLIFAGFRVLRRDVA